MIRTTLLASMTAVAVFASAPSFAAKAAPQSWYAINQQTGECKKSPMSPREFDTGLRSASEPSELTVHRSDLDQAIIAVTVKYWTIGQKMEITFYSSPELCSAMLAVLIKRGDILPPDVK